MTDKRINEWIDREPFQPFKIVTAGGKEHEVTDPHAAATSRRQTFIFGPNEQNVLLQNH